MAINENEKVARAEKLLKEALADPETRRILEIKERARIDRKLDLSQAYNNGKKEREKEIAKKMLQKGMAQEEIAEITELTKEEIEKL